MCWNLHDTWKFLKKVSLELCITVHVPVLCYLYYGTRTCITVPVLRYTYLYYVTCITVHVPVLCYLYYGTRTCITVPVLRYTYLYYVTCITVPVLRYTYLYYGTCITVCVVTVVGCSTLWLSRHRQHHGLRSSCLFISSRELERLRHDVEIVIN